MSAKTSCLGWSFPFLVLVYVPPALAAPRGEADRVRLTADGKALLPVVVSGEASQRVRQAARTLADYLQRISGAKFEVVRGDGTSGIAVGVAAHFPALPSSALWKDKSATQNEDYLLHSHAGGLHVLGASELAVEHAVWDVLDRLGYRQFFPGATWEVVPSRANLDLAVEAREHPSYSARRIWYGSGPGKWAVRPYAEWCARNRATSGIVLNTGHSYDGILARHKAEFAKHPEYLGLRNGQRTSSKFCISNPDLRKLVIDDALAQFQKDPELQSVSVDPSDGGGWCACEKCKAMGSVSDRAVTLANAVAAAVEAKYPGQKYVGMYAYSEHSPPPSIRVHPRVIISVATGFIRGDYTVDDLLDGWRRQGATLGIREYYSVHPWDRDLPGRARGANLAYLKTTLPHFHDQGARFLSAESSDNWGCNGLGYYLAARMLWDVDAAKRIDALTADFLEKAFGPAQGPMAEFYRLLDGANRPLLSDHLLGRMYRLLAEARKRTDDPKIQARLRDLVLYTRYVECWLDYTVAAGPQRQKAFETMVRHAYRIRSTMMIHTRGLVRDLPRRDKLVKLPIEAGANVPENKNPWLSDVPFSREEVDGIVSAGIAQRSVIDFQPVSFGDKLVPASRLRLPPVKTGSMGLYSRGVRNYHTWIERAPARLSLQARAGLIYGDRGTAKVALYPAGRTESKAVDRAAVVADKQEHVIELKTTCTGHHRLEVADRAAGTSLNWPDGVPMTVRSSPEDPDTFHGTWSLYFYVPKGTTVVGGYASGSGSLLDGSGKIVYTFAKKPGYFRVPVAPGADGKLWQFQRCSGQRLLMTVPPYLARNEKELLLPEEVVEKDAAR